MDPSTWFDQGPTDSMITHAGMGVGSPTRDIMSQQTVPPDTPEKEARRYATRATVKKLHPKTAGKKKTAGSRTIGDEDVLDDEV